MLVILGESENDRVALLELLRAICPRAEATVLRTPMVLIKNASPASAPKHADKVAEAVRAVAARGRVECVFAHEDADAQEPADQVVAKRIEDALTRAGTPGTVHAVVPAWEIEAWWFMWPDLVASCCKSWKQPIIGTRPGQIANAKEKLARAVRPANQTPDERKRFRNYAESDSITIARAIRSSARHDEPKRGLCPSYDRFRDGASSCCAAQA